MSDNGVTSIDDIFAAIRNGKSPDEYEKIADAMANDPLYIAQQEALERDWPDVKIPALPTVRTVEKPDLTAGKWLTDYVEYANRCSPMSPDIFNEAMGAWLLSAAVARRVYLPVSTGNIFPNLYTLLIGPPGLVRKSSTLSIASDVARKAGVMLLPSIGTVESLSIELSYTRQPVSIESDREEYQRWFQERALAAQRGLLLDEASGLFEAGRKDYMAQLKPTLLAWYDCPDELKFNMTVSRGRSTAKNAYLALAGATTPSAMERYFSKQSVEWGDGTWSRFNLIIHEVLPDFQFFENKKLEPGNQLLERLNYLFSVALPLPKVSFVPKETDEEGKIIDSYVQVEPLQAKAIQIASTAWQSWKGYAEALHALAQWDYRYGGKKLSALYTRIAFHAIKIAMLLAITDWAERRMEGVLRIEQPHWDRAQWISERWRASVHRVDSLLNEMYRPDVQQHHHQPDTLKRDAESLFQLVLKKGSVKNRDLTQHTSSWGGDRDTRVGKAMAHLQNSGRIKYDEDGKTYTLAT